MRKITFLVFFMYHFLIVAQKNKILIGVVSNNKGEVLNNVTVLIPAIKRGTSTAVNGGFMFTNLLQGTYTLQISSIGYTTIEKEVNIDKEKTSIAIILPEKVESLDEVIVSYDKVKKIKLKESLPVEVISATFINENLGGSLMQSLDRLAGVSMIQIGSGQSKPVIRGLSFNRVLVAEKGLKHEAQQWGADHGLEIDQFDSQNIELIKGPSSLRFGGDAIGGVIHIKRNNFPNKNTLNGDISSSFMSNNESFSSSVFLESRGEHFLIGGRFTNIKYGDYKAPTNTVSVYSLEVPLYKNRLRNTAGREGSFHFHTGYVSDTFHSVFYGSRYAASSGFFANAHGLEPRKVDEKVHDRFSNDILEPLQEVTHIKVTNETQFTVNNHQLKLVTGFQRNDREERGPYVSHGYMPPKFPDNSGIPSNLERKFIKDFYAATITDSFTIGKHGLEIGVNGNYQKNTIGGWGFIIPSFSSYTLGTFVIDNYKFNENFSISSGFRYDYGFVDIEKYVDWFPSKIDDQGNEAYLTRVPNFSKGYQNISFSAGLIYNKNELTFKANIGNSFRMPLPKELAANGVNYHYFRYERGNLRLNPERSYQVDVSAEWNEKNWAIQVSPFVNYFPNYIYLNPTPEFDKLYGASNQIFDYSQSKVFRYGGEVHAHIDLFKHLQLGTIAELVSSKQLSGEKKNFGLPFAPPSNILFNARYTFNPYGVLMNPYMSADLKIVDNQYDIVPPEEFTEGYEIVNLALGSDIRLHNYIVQFNFQVKNMLDTKYFDHTSFYRLINLPAQGRNFIATVKLSF